MAYNYPSGDIDTVLGSGSFPLVLDTLFFQADVYNFNILTLFDVTDGTVDVAEVNYILVFEEDYGRMKPVVNYNRTLQSIRIGDGYHNLRLFNFFRLGGELYFSFDTEDAAFRFEYVELDAAFDLLAVLISLIVSEKDLESALVEADASASYADLYFNNTLSYHDKFDALYWGFEAGLKISLIGGLAIVHFGFARNYENSHLFIPDSWNIFFRVQVVFGQTMNSASVSE